MKQLQLVGAIAVLSLGQGAIAPHVFATEKGKNSSRLTQNISTYSETNKTELRNVPSSLVSNDYARYQSNLDAAESQSKGQNYLAQSTSIDLTGTWVAGTGTGGVYRNSSCWTPRFQIRQNGNRLEVYQDIDIDNYDINTATDQTCSQTKVTLHSVGTISENSFEFIQTTESALNYGKKLVDAGANSIPYCMAEGKPSRYTGQVIDDNNIVITEYPCYDEVITSSYKRYGSPAPVPPSDQPTPPLPQPTPPQPQPNPRDRRLTDAEAQQILANLRERAKREGWTFELKDSEIFRISIELITGGDFPENFRPQLFDIIDLVQRLIRDRRLPPNPQPAPPNPQPLPPGQLPTRFDAREWNVVPPIRYQQTCGSCWAFASLGSYETAYATLLGQPNTLDLSEQQLLDCNSENWSCHGGKVSQDNSAYRNLLDSGFVNEQTYPYQNQQGQCQRFPTPNSGNLYRAGAFRFVAQGNPSSRQTIDAIKAAVWTYGSAWITVYAGDEFDRAFQGYSGGVFNACNNKDLNHAVNIIGWDDAGGYWIMRNSWGPNWGENGYMRIVYGCNNIGEFVAVPQQLELLNCAGGSCQSVAPTAPPWLSQPAPAPQPPRPEPQPVPPNPQPQPQPDDGWGPRPDNNRPPNNTPAPGNYW